MVIFLLIAAGMAGVPAWRALDALLQQIPHRNDDFDLSLLGHDDTPETAAVAAPRAEASGVAGHGAIAAGVS